MKVNILNILCILLLAAFMIGAVSASENLTDLPINEINDDSSMDSLEMQDNDIKEIENDNQLVNGKVTMEIDYTEHMWVDGRYNITVTLPESYNGRLAVNMENEQFTGNLTNGKGTIELPELNILKPYKIGYSKTNAYLNYYDNNNYDQLSESFTVYLHGENPDSTDIVDFPSNFYINDEYKTFILTTPINTGGKVDICYDGKFYESVKLDDAYSHSISLPSQLALGQHNATIRFYNSKYLKDSNTTAYFSLNNINVIPPDYPDYDYRSDNAVKIQTGENVTGYVTVFIDGAEYAKELLYDSYNIIKLYGFCDGKHDGYVIYSGDKNNPQANISFEYWKYTSPAGEDMKLVVSTNDTAVGSYVTVSVIAYDSQTGNVTVKAYDKEYVIILESGHGSASIYIDDYEFYEFYGYYGGDENHSPKTIGNVFEDTVMTHYGIVAPNYISFDESPTISLTLPQNATGNLTVTLNGETYSAKLINGKANITLPAPNDDIKYYAEYAGDDYEISPINSTIGVYDIMINMPDNAYLNENPVMSIELPDIYDNVSVFEGNKLITSSELIGGKANITLENLSLGYHSLKVKYGFKSKSTSIKIIANITLAAEEMYAGSENVVSIALPEDATGTLTVQTTDGVMIGQDTAKDGKASVSLSSLSPGLYGINAKYKDVKYGESDNYYMQVRVSKGDVNVSAKDTIAGLAIEFSQALDGCVKVVCENESYFELISQGKAIIDNIHPKDSITLSMCENDKGRIIKDKIIAVETKTINPELAIKASNIIVGKTAIINITANEYLNADILVSIDNANCTAQLVNGKASLEIHDLNAGKHIVSVMFKGSEYFNAGQAKKTFEVEKIATKITASKMTAVYNTGKYLVVTLKDKNNNALAGVKVSITINKKTTNPTTDNKGQVKILLNQIPNTYTVTIKSQETKYYKQTSSSVKVTIKKATPKLTTSKKTYRAKATKKLSATLKDNKGKVLKNKQITFKVNGKTYKAKTNSKGVATAKVKVTKKGSYKVTVRYGGDKYFNSITKTTKLIVKK